MVGQGQRAEQMLERVAADSAKAGATLQRDNDGFMALLR